MDKAVCYLDASGIVDSISIVKKIKAIFPGLCPVSEDTLRLMGQSRTADRIVL